MRLWTVIVWKKSKTGNLEFPFPIAHVEAETAEEAAKIYTDYEYSQAPVDERPEPKQQKDGFWLWGTPENTWTGTPFFITELSVIRHGDVKKAD